MSKRIPEWFGKRDKPVLKFIMAYFSQFEQSHTIHKRAIQKEVKQQEERPKKLAAKIE